MSERQQWVVEAERAGLRLDKFLVASCPGLGRRRAAWWIDRGRVLVGGRRVSKGYGLRVGDVVTAPAGLQEQVVAELGAPLATLLEAVHYVVVDKPAGQPTAPLHPQEEGTLAGALLGRYPEMAGIGHGPREPGLLHRLDTFTSGAVVAARTSVGFDQLWRALQAGQLQKRYLAIVADRAVPDHAVVRSALRVGPGGKVIVVEAEPSALERESRVRVVERRGGRALLEVTAKRAFRHQVRAHLAHRGWPLLGDIEYGGAAAPRLGRRHALHASYVAWAGTDEVPGFCVECPLSRDLKEFFER